MIVVDSVTDLSEVSSASVAVTGSHGGLFSGRAALSARLRGVVFSDAGVGLHEAGIAALEFLAEHGIAAAAVSIESARIGDGHDVAQCGIVSRCNEVAARLGVEPGMTCRESAERMARNTTPIHPAYPAAPEARTLLADREPKVWALDSASLAHLSDCGAVLLTGSHGGLPGGDPARALTCTPILAAFNDAGVGKDQAGLSRLRALDERQVPAITVGAATARIGSGDSTYRDGVISHVNDAARRLGAAAGASLREYVDRFVHERHYS
jgi:hypothetical protein